MDQRSMMGFVMQRMPPIQLSVVAPITQDVAIVMGGGGDPFAEWERAKALCDLAGKKTSIFAGNDMIEKFPHDIDHAISLHPDKLKLWLPRRRAAGFNDPPKVWGHRNYEGAVTHWTRDWSGSTGLFCVKIAREHGFVHIIGCGVPMTVEDNHFLRPGQRWDAAHGFRRGWEAHLQELKPYFRSYSGWTLQEFGAPTEEWLKQDIEDLHLPTYSRGLRA
jgi:hypothetical protein